MITELKYNQLKFFCDENDITLEDVKADNKIIGQSEGAEALRFGLSVKKKGYNVYVAGLSNSGKTTFATEFAKKIAANEPTPDDICYIYNFKNPNSPKILKIAAGEGKKLKETMEELISMLSVEIPKAFSSYEYEEERERITKETQKNKDAVIKNLTEEAKEFDFGVKVGPNGGVYFLPIVDGKTINEEEFEALDEEEKETITEGSDEVQALASKAMKEIRLIDKKAKAEIEKNDYNIALMVTGRFITPIQESYCDNIDVTNYLIDVKEDILNNYQDFLNDDDDSSDDPIASVMPWLNRKDSSDYLYKYKINLIVDNSQLKGAPVIVDYNPTYTNLVGEVEYESENGNFVTDFMKIKPGIIHKANGGYLIFNAFDIFGNAFAWETIRKVLKTNKVKIEPLKEYQLGGITVAGIQPESCPVEFKVIIIGSMYYYELLKEYDDDFAKLFKICAIFDYEMDNNKDNISSLVSFIKDFVENQKMLPLSVGAVGKIIEYSARMSERQDRFSTRFGILCDIISEAEAWAKIEGANEISSLYIEKAIEKRIARADIYTRKHQQMIVDNEIMIDTEGKKIGQVNGLCVMEMNEYTFGMPTRITASVYTGKAGIVNIEKESEMSGSIHDKGVQVLTGYLGGKYAQKFPLTLSCRLCFEQSYSGVDGDSATTTETYAIISALSELPVNQELAVTGSMNQFGEIQPIGGVTYKIEGFYDICKKRGLTGSQGVIIPRQNIKDLVLKNEVIDAVKSGKFHIFAIDNIDDGLELLLGVKAGKKLSRGSFTKDSIHYRAYEKLKNYYKLNTAN
ncbi:MAG: AAA family ATPase [Lachnospirales bacterium]